LVVGGVRSVPLGLGVGRLVIAALVSLRTRRRAG